jgi:hypothetical protein
MLKSKFESIVREIRSDYDNIKKLHTIFLNKTTRPIDEETRTWITDVYLDKAYELNSKLNLLFTKTSKRGFPVNIDNALIQFEKASHKVAYSDTSPNPSPILVGDVTNNLYNFIREIEWSLSELRKNLFLSNWSEISKIKPIEFANIPRRKYITAREEVDKAKGNLAKNHEDVMMHLRNAIDLSLKERFGFKKIQFMGTFFEEAKDYGFPLPSYDLIYQYFNEGSKRSHQGKTHTQFEAQEAVRTVSNFIDELETLEVSQKMIDEFISKSQVVK